MVCPDIRDSTSGDTGVDLDYYYTRYQPDRMQAVMALRIDTGMNPMQAQEMIDLIFDFYENKAAMNNHEMQCSKEVVRCPKCQSPDVVMRETQRTLPHYTAFYRTSEARLAASILRLFCTIADVKNRNQLRCVCMKCGYEWQPE